MELQREMESKHSAGTWASVGGSGTAPKPATDEFERAFRLGRKREKRIPVATTLNSEWCPHLVQRGNAGFHAESPDYLLHPQSCAGGGRASSTIPQSGVGKLELHIK